MRLVLLLLLIPAAAGQELRPLFAMTEAEGPQGLAVDGQADVTVHYRIYYPFRTNLLVQNITVQWQTPECTPGLTARGPVEQFLAVPLPTPETMEGTATFTVAADNAPGERDLACVYKALVKSHGPGWHDSDLSAITSPHSVPYRGGAHAVAAPLQLGAGQAGNALLDVTNTGNAPSRMTFQVLSDSWASKAPEPVTVDANATKRVLLNVQAPHSAESATILVQVTPQSTRDELAGEPYVVEVQVASVCPCPVLASSAGVPVLLAALAFLVHRRL